MKAVIAKPELLKKLTDMVSVAGRNDTMPILSHLLLHADGATSHVRATDLSEAILEPIALTASVPGSVCVPAKKLLDIIKELEGDIAIETSEDGAKVMVKSGKSVFKLACMPAAEFPVFSRTGHLKGFEMPGAVFGSAIERTIYAVGVADTRYVLNGLLLDITKEGISFVATDGHRLSIVSLKGSLPLEPVRFIVTKKALTEVKRHVTADSPVKVLPNGNSVVFEVGKVTLVSRLIEGTYPDYAQVIPQGHQSAAVVNREALLKAARRVSLMNEQNAIRLTFAKDLVSVAASSADLGDAEDHVEITYDGADLALGMNAKYLVDALAAAQTERVEVRLGDALSPVLIAEEGKDDFTAVVMPMRL